MSPNVRILSTKHLSAKQLDAFKGGLIEEETFISSKYLKTEWKPYDSMSVVFTSQHAVRAAFEQNLIKIFQIHQVFCVGEKTAKLLKSYGLKADLVAPNAQELAEEIIFQKLATEIVFFCGNLSRPDLPNYLLDHDVVLEKVPLYETYLTNKELTKKYKIVLFFSPSGIESYINGNNQIEDIVVFCIGGTTATKATEYFDEIFIAESPSVESVIESVNEYCF